MPPSLSKNKRVKLRQLINKFKSTKQSHDEMVLDQKKKSRLWNIKLVLRNCFTKNKITKVVVNALLEKKLFD